jgi:hypothetical protein
MFNIVVILISYKHSSDLIRITFLTISLVKSKNAVVYV